MLAARGRRPEARGAAEGQRRADMGGEGAQLTPEDSAIQLQKLIDKLDIASTGKFLAWNGKELAW